MTIKETVISSRNDNYKEEFSRLNEEDFLIIEEAQNRLHLRNTIGFVKELDSFVNDHDLSSYDLRMTREANASEDITYSGWWSLTIDIEDPITGEQVISDELYAELFTIASRFNTYQFEARINERYEDKTFLMPLSDLSKCYEFFLPSNTLKEFQASSLDLDLSNDQPISKRKCKL